MVSIYDVVVVGAGPAGLTTASLLAESSLRVLLEAKADPLNLSFHTLGSFLSREKFGLSEKVIAAEIDFCTIHSKHLKTRKSGKAFILNKKELHRELLEKCHEAEVEIKTSTRILKATTHENGDLRSLISEKGEEFFGKLFVDASGISGSLSKQFGVQDSKHEVASGLEYNARYLGPQNEAHLFVGAGFRGGYGWIFPIGASRAIVGFGTFDGTAQREIKKRLDGMFKLKHLKRVIDKDEEKVYGGTIPITEVKEKFVYKNLVCVGDSVSQVNPLVGEGYRFILEASALAAKYITDSINYSNTGLLENYEREWKTKYLVKYQLAKNLQRLASLASQNDILSDLFNLLMWSKRSRTAERIISGDLNLASLLLP